MRKKLMFTLWVIFIAAVVAVAYVFYEIERGAIGYMPNLQ